MLIIIIMIVIVISSVPPWPWVRCVRPFLHDNFILRPLCSRGEAAAVQRIDEARQRYCFCLDGGPLIDCRAG